MAAVLNFIGRPIGTVVSEIDAFLDGSGDASVAVGAALDDLGTNGGIVRGTPGSDYAFNTPIVFDHSHAWLDLRGCRITTTLTSGAIITLGQDVLAAASQNWGVLGGFFYVNHASVDAFRIIRCQNLEFAWVQVYGARYGWFFDGNVAEDIRVLSAELRSCYTGNCVNGYRFKAPNPQNTSFDCFLMATCASESDAIGVYFEGELAQSRNGLTLSNCEIQNSSVAGLYTDFGRVTVNEGTYIETASPLTVPSISANNSSLISIDSSVAPFPVADATSTIIARNSHLTELGVLASDSRLGASDYEAFAWGPPNYPVSASKPGHTAAVGFRSIDKQGVAWVATFAGDTSGAPLVRYMPELGVVVVPFTFSTYTNGSEIWHPQENFVIESIDLVVTTTFSGGALTGITIGTTAQKCFISDVQGAVANLVATAVLASGKNADGSATLVGGARHYMAGSDFNSSPGANAIYYYQAGGAATAGAATLIIKGRRV